MFFIFTRFCCFSFHLFVNKWNFSFIKALFNKIVVAFFEELSICFCIKHLKTPAVVVIFVPKIWKHTKISTLVCYIYRPTNTKKLVERKNGNKINNNKWHDVICWHKHNKYKCHKIYRFKNNMYLLNDFIIFFENLKEK